MSKFQSNPRDFALELVEECVTSADHLLLCCLKYMSHDDVREMLEANELAPNTCDNCGEESECDECEECEQARELEEYLDDHSEGYDVEAMRADIENNNLDVGDDASDYEYEAIVKASILNGQITQAREQCKAYGLDFDDINPFAE